MISTLKSIFTACAQAVTQGELIQRVSKKDKEFSFQNWFGVRLDELGLNVDEPSRNAYPDFRLVDYPIGFEIKGLGFPGRVANYDCNSQVPSGIHNGRTIYYVFGRYPAKVKGKQYPVYDLVFCHGDFLNADHDYVHKNKNIKGFGSYGDMMVRDRKMYVAPTPYALTTGTEREITLIVPDRSGDFTDLEEVGAFERVETDRLIRGYSFDMIEHTLEPRFIPNPNGGVSHPFKAYRAFGKDLPRVEMRSDEA